MMNHFETVSSGLQVILIFFIFQVNPIFDDLYDSREIGWVRVGDLSFQSKTWTIGELESKCLILPEKIKQALKNPRPDNIRESDDPLKKYTDTFGGRGEYYQWNVVPLLQPSKTTVQNLYVRAPNMAC